MMNWEEIRKEMVRICDGLAPTYYRQAPETNTEFPVIVYQVLNEADMVEGDNTSFIKEAFIRITVTHETDAEPLAREVEKEMKASFYQVRLRDFRDITELTTDPSSYTLEFQFLNIQN